MADPVLPIRAKSRSGPPIQTLADWKDLASSEGKWAEGFSALALARLWLAGQGPVAVVSALRPVLPELQITDAVAEAQISFDRYRGGVRNHDVLAYGQIEAGECVVGVEGKVNEPLDDRISGKYAAAESRRARGKHTNLDQRVDGLLDAIVGKRVDADHRIAGLRYQLFSALAGTVAAATRDTKAAAVVIHLIQTPNAQHTKFEQTRVAIADFATVVGLDSASSVVGPIKLQQQIGSAPIGLPLWLAITQSACLPAERRRSSRG